MEQEEIASILKALNKLLEPMSPHSLVYEWDNILGTLKQNNLKFEIRFVRQYYLDSNLTAILGKKNTSKFEEASRWRAKEKKIIDSNPKNEVVKLRTEPSFFEYSKDNNAITAYLNTTENQRLIFLLIEQYNLLKK